MSAQTTEELKYTPVAMAARGSTSMPGPDDDPDDYPWPIRIRIRRELLEHIRFSQLVQSRLSTIVSALTVESIARSAGPSGDAMLKSSQAMLSEAGDWICGNDLLWLLRFRKKFKDLIPGGWWLPDPPKPMTGLEQRPEVAVLNELAGLRTSLPAKSGLGAGIDRFMDGISTRIEAGLKA